MELLTMQNHKMIHSMVIFYMCDMQNDFTKRNKHNCKGDKLLSERVLKFICEV